MAGQWVYSPKKPKKPKVPPTVKADISVKAQALIDDYFKPTFIREVPPDYQWNYVADIYGKWYRNYYYFISIYHCPGPNAISPSFEAKFARMEYVGPDSFHLAYMRHNNKWAEVIYDVSLADAFLQLQTSGFFQP